jgi:hypothetical protein
MWSRSTSVTRQAPLGSGLAAAALREWLDVRAVMRNIFLIVAGAGAVCGRAAVLDSDVVGWKRPEHPQQQRTSYDKYVYLLNWGRFNCNIDGAQQAVAMAIQRLAGEDNRRFDCRVCSVFFGALLYSAAASISFAPASWFTRAAR